MKIRMNGYTCELLGFGFSNFLVQYKRKEYVFSFPKVGNKYNFLPTICILDTKETNYDSQYSW